MADNLAKKIENPEEDIDIKDAIKESVLHTVPNYFTEESRKKISDAISKEIEESVGDDIREEL